MRSALAIRKVGFCELYKPPSEELGDKSGFYTKRLKTLNNFYKLKIIFLHIVLDDQTDILLNSYFIFIGKKSYD
jgi:hypothetical protein